jgi:23S rRNA pseudouridine2605 synthase
MSFKQRQQKSARTSAARVKRKQVRRAVKNAAVKEPDNDPRFANRNELRVEHSDTQPRADGVRLQKALADAGVAARRDCEQLIVAGRIHVNGKPVLELPCFVDPHSDVVSLDGVPVDLSATTTKAARKPGVDEQRTYLLINKPKGMITTARDPEGRPTVLQMVPKAIAERERLFPVGRLDADSTGLLLLTNDGDLAYQLTHPKFGVMKEYRVTAVGMADDEQLQQLKKGMYLMTPDGAGPARSKRASLDNVRVIKRFVDRNRGNRTVLSIKLREGQNREIRRLLARIGLKVRDLERVAIGPLRIGALKPGQCKLLGRRDVDALRAAVLSAST